jgi:hypothetical protein
MVTRQPPVAVGVPSAQGCFSRCSSLPVMLCAEHEQRIAPTGRFGASTTLDAAHSVRYHGTQMAKMADFTPEKPFTAE